MMKTPCPRQVQAPAQDCRPQPHPGCMKVQREAARGDSAPAPAPAPAEGRACQGEQPALPVRGRMSAIVAPPRPLLQSQSCTASTTKQHCTALCCTVLHWSVLYCTALYCTVLYCTTVCHEAGYLQV